MWYGDKREAKVMIHNELVNRGWKTYGFSEDQSDSMTDYYHPASWDGIAEKNGFVLIIDQSYTNYSGYEVKKYDYSNMKASAKNNDKIQKLQALANDEGATEGEKAAALAGIERLSAKNTDNKTTYTIEETYPVFTSGNPGKCSWHIEKDGQILAKGTGVFAVNDYDWENKDKTAAEQKQEKLLALVNRFEKVLKDADALESEVIKVPKQVIKPVETNKTSLTASEVNDNTYFIMKVNYTNGNSKGTMYKCERASTVENAESFIFGRLGKNLKPSKARGKTWYLDIACINELLSKGHIAIVEMQEFTEYEEKTVFKKTARKQAKQEQTETLTGTVTETEQEDNNSTAEASYTINGEKNGIEIKFTQKPSKNIIEGLKENGFRWSSFTGVWWAKQTADRLRFAEMLTGAYNSIIQEEPETAEEEDTETEHNSSKEEPQETDDEKYNENQDNSQDNVIDFEEYKSNITAEEKENDEVMTEDILNAFDEITIENNSRIASEDQQFCETQERLYSEAENVYNSVLNQLQQIYTAYEDKENGYIDNYSDINRIIERVQKIKESFINKVCWYFEKKYNVTIDESAINNKYKEKSINSENVLDEIFIQLDGFSFEEKSLKEIKHKLKDIVHNSYRDEWKMEIKNNSITFNTYLTWSNGWKSGEVETGYSADKVTMPIFTALSHFETGRSEVISQFQAFTNYRLHGDKDVWFTNWEIYNTDKIAIVRFYKNGRIDIKFHESKYTFQFAKEYCGYVGKAA